MIDYTEKDFDIKKLGSFPSSVKTTFRLFAPESSEISLVIGKQTFKMHKKGFTFEISLVGNLDGKAYHYVNEKGVSFKDPFAYASNSTDSFVLNPKKFIKEKIKTFAVKPIIYEVNVRDFSCDNSYPAEPKRKFISLTKPDLKLNNYHMIGLDYLVNLGVSYVQLMPVFDYDLDKTNYNWGYNPKAFNHVYKEYVNNPDDPYAYVNELRQVINQFHARNIKVTFDVVFNHVYSDKTYDLGKIMPHHAYRYKADGKLGNGAFCGNELKSEDPFMRAYFIEMVERYVDIFDADGVRMDLMGILDIQTVNGILAAARKIKPEFMVYGEGWNMGDVLQESRRASLNNAHELREVGMFNDYFRQALIRGIVDEQIDIEAIKQSLMGTNNNLIPSQSINYVECHDNNTFFDRLMLNGMHDSLQMNIAKAKLALALVMISRGIPFVHAGQEFLRTKHLVENSYNKPEEINKIDWYRRVEYNDICDYFKDLCSLRNHYNFTKEVSFDEYDPILVYHIGNLSCFINFSRETVKYDFHSFCEIIFNENGLCDKMSENVNILPFSLVITKKYNI